MGARRDEPLVLVPSRKARDLMRAPHDTDPHVFVITFRRLP